MITYQREELIDQLKNETEIALQKAISVWQLIPHSKFARKPSPEAWSANECLQHLNSYGKYYLPAIERAIIQSQSKERADQFSPGRLGSYFTKVMLPETSDKPLKKMKSPKNHTPKLIVESHLVISEFIDQQEKLLQLLHMARHVDLNEKKVGISIAPFIKLKLGDVFMFLIAHITRHTLQAERSILRADMN
jgi:hypothetical protein